MVGASDTVPMQKLDTWRAAHPGPRIRAVKMDIEGGELDALRGAVNLLRKEHPLLVCEIIEEFADRKGSDRTEICKLLESLGYRIRWLEGTWSPTIVADPDPG